MLPENSINSWAELEERPSSCRISSTRPTLIWITEASFPLVKLLVKLYRTYRIFFSGVPVGASVTSISLFLEVEDEGSFGTSSADGSLRVTRGNSIDVVDFSNLLFGWLDVDA